MVHIVQLVRTSDCGSEGRRFESDYVPHGEMAEWTIAPVLKTGGPKGPGGFESLSPLLNKNGFKMYIGPHGSS